MTGIRQLAQHLNLSIGTVSRALNGKPDVNDETRRRVLDAAAAIGYVPNQAGRSLRQGNTNAIGFMIELGADINGNSDTFFMGVFDGVQSVLARHHLDLVALPCPTDENPSAYLQRMIGRRLVDGLIISATHRKDPRIDLLMGARIPFVALGRSETPGDYPWLDLDFDGVARRAIDRLVAAGHSRIAAAVPSNDINLGFVFLDGYKAALKRHGLPFDPGLVMRVPSSELGGYQLGHDILAMENRPSAIVLHYELLALGLYRQLAEAGLQPGRDLAIIGFRDNPVSRYMSPRLTCFRLSLRDLGISLAEALLANMPGYADQYPLGVVRRVVPMDLVDGRSDVPPA
ncbi:MAG: LacI family DNA-binding transcriptional regulator [Devosia sp.]|uniref:LacI family DNA-binding transcriptional regulator n=1 Tax=Devosia sp. TaxID=1871048 RepID=UPI0024CAFD8A|nr:LacI family DNA-binding transcriptional regulator [Devosia sp.]UYN98571.1 MAG: LacI family DNA-binding transcriptional regulator [Devosia sp.]